MISDEEEIVAAASIQFHIESVIHPPVEKRDNIIIPFPGVDRAKADL